MRDPVFDILFEPVRIGPKTLRNRFYQVPHSTGFGSERPRSQAAFREARAAGGWAAISVELTSIDPESDRNPVPVPVRLWDEDDVAALRLTADAAHRHGALAGIELWHGGSAVDAIPSRGLPGGASQLPSDAFPLTYPRELDVGGIREVQELYVAAARRAEAAGFDIVYVYGAHGYLPAQFLSPFSNHRTDEYGGSLENRARFWIETLERVRAAVGARCAVAVRLGLDPSERSGVGLDDALAFVRLADHLVDLWDVNTSVIAEPWLDMRPSRLGPQGYQVKWSGRVRAVTDTPIVGVSRLTDPMRMVEIIRSGVWDLIGAARPSIADPELPRKLEQGRLGELRPCIGCNICIARVSGQDQIACTQNPTAGEEFRRGWHPGQIAPAPDPERSLLVVGGGVAGLELALTATRRGLRHVRLVEASAELGGTARRLSRLPGLSEWEWLVSYRETQLRSHSSAQLSTGTAVDAAAVLASGARVVILATGAAWVADGTSPHRHAPIPGWDAPHVTTPERVLAGHCPDGARVVVYDCEGYLTGVGLAELLAGEGRSVTLLTPHKVVGAFLDRTLEGVPARTRLHALRVDVRTGRDMLAIEPDACLLHHYRDEERLAADVVVLVTSRRSDDALLRTLRAEPDALARAGIEAVYAVGDCVAPRLLADCIFDAHRLARELESARPDRPLPFRRERPAA